MPCNRRKQPYLKRVTCGAMEARAMRSRQRDRWVRWAGIHSRDRADGSELLPLTRDLLLRVNGHHASCEGTRVENISLHSVYDTTKCTRDGDTRRATNDKEWQVVSAISSSTLPISNWIALPLADTEETGPALRAHRAAQPKEK
jgi:hypothetical protein